MPSYLGGSLLGPLLFHLRISQGLCLGLYFISQRRKEVPQPTTAPPSGPQADPQGQGGFRGCHPSLVHPTGERGQLKQVVQEDTAVSARAVQAHGLVVWRLCHLQPVLSFDAGMRIERCWR